MNTVELTDWIPVYCENVLIGFVYDLNGTKLNVHRWADHLMFAKIVSHQIAFGKDFLPPWVTSPLSDY